MMSLVSSDTPCRCVSTYAPTGPGRCSSGHFVSSTLRDLREDETPISPIGPSLRIVDLFSGCGPFTLGAAEAARSFGMHPHVALAVDLDLACTEVFESNFRDARVLAMPVELLFDGELGAPLTETEHETAQLVGDAHVLLGGPPCQGHSDLNNHTRRRDARNSLYRRMARAVEVLRPAVAIFENVPTIVHAVDDVVGAARITVEAAGYTTAGEVFDLSNLGVPQRRKRHVLIATSATSGVDAGAISARISEMPFPQRSAEWALKDLVGRAGSTVFDTPTRVSAENTKRIRWLFEHEAFDLPNRLRPPCHQGNHSYRSMYGRLRWDEPAQTITTGFGSMGQGRFVHPLEPRMLTAHEAARLQGIPDYFRFEAADNRTTMRRLIGNAVPPVLSEAIVYAALEQIGHQPICVGDAYKSGDAWD